MAQMATSSTSAPPGTAITRLSQAGGPLGPARR
jgi:hypothetical protein